MVEVIFTDEFRKWIESNEEAVRDRLTARIRILRQFGIATPFPYSSMLFGTKYNFRELRAEIKDKPYRMIYTFNPKRNAIMLLGGDKSGEKRWYEKSIAKAEKIYEKYLAGENI